MEDLLTAIIMLGIYLAIKVSVERKVDNFPTDNLSIGKMTMDAGKSKSYIKNKMIKGEYNKDEHWKI